MGNSITVFHDPDDNDNDNDNNNNHNNDNHGYYNDDNNDNSNDDDDNDEPLTKAMVSRPSLGITVIASVPLVLVLV